MDFYDVVRKRRSIRGYKGDPISAEKLDRICEAVRLAPTACNLQPFRFLLVSDAETKAALGECYRQPWLTQAPIIVVALGNATTAWKRMDGTSAHTIDVSIAMEHLVLAATAEGLGTCWICAFDQTRAHQKLKLGPEWEVVAMTPLGVSDTDPKNLQRKEMSELIERI